MLFMIGSDIFVVASFQNVLSQKCQQQEQPSFFIESRTTLSFVDIIYIKAQLLVLTNLKWEKAITIEPCFSLFRRHLNVLTFLGQSKFHIYSS